MTTVLITGANETISRAPSDRRCSMCRGLRRWVGRRPRDLAAFAREHVDALMVASGRAEAVGQAASTARQRPSRSIHQSVRSGAAA